MVECFLGTDQTISALGFSSAELVEQIKAHRTGIRMIPGGRFSLNPVALALIDEEKQKTLFRSGLIQEGSIEGSAGLTRLEILHILSISEVLKNSGVDIRDSRTLLIVSTTKGNIELLEKDRYPGVEPERLFLWKLAEVLRNYFGNPNKPLVVSNACISGVLAILFGARLIKAGFYDHIIVSGGDLATEFVVSGFQSFQALSPGPCKPFDRDRDGLSLGEGCSTIVLSRDHSLVGIPEKIMVAGGASSNDAHHLSGPSRTGEGLFQAIRRSLQEAALDPSEVDYISAHGTATDYNDEMEAKAFYRAGLEAVPVNSFKGYVGHTLGAAGIIESVLARHSLQKNILFKSAGFNNSGTSKPLNILNDHQDKVCHCCLKTASGFGGCNGVLVFKKI